MGDIDQHVRAGPCCSDFLHPYQLRAPDAPLLMHTADLWQSKCWAGDLSCANHVPSAACPSALTRELGLTFNRERLRIPSASPRTTRARACRLSRAGRVELSVGGRRRHHNGALERPPAADRSRQPAVACSGARSRRAEESGNPAAGGSQDLADVLPCVQLVRKLAQLRTECVAGRNHADQPAVVLDDRDVPETALVHYV